MDDFKYISYEEKRKLRINQERAAAGRSLKRGIGYALSGMTLSVIAGVAGLGGLAVSMPIIIGSSLGGPLVARYFQQKRMEKYENEIHDMLGPKQ